MKQTLQIVFCILSCLSVAAALVVGTLFGFVYCLIAVAAAVVFAALMFMIKNSAGAEEEQKHGFMCNDTETNSEQNDGHDRTHDGSGNKD